MKYRVSYRLDDISMNLNVEAKNIKDARKQTREYIKNTYPFFVKYKFICALNETGEMCW